jgi:NADPH2:quinone reductase
MGVFWGAWVGREPRANAQNLKEIFDFFEAGKIKPQISASYKLEDVGKAFEDLMERRVKGKVVLTP